MGSAWQQCRMPNADCVLLRWAAAGSDMNAWCDLKLRTKEFALAVIRLVQSLNTEPPLLAGKPGICEFGILQSAFGIDTLPS